MPVCCRHPHCRHLEIGILLAELLKRAVMETAMNQGAIAAAA